MLQLDGVTIAMEHRPLCTNFSFTCHKGDIWGILGPNGCGKTSLLHTMAGIHTPAAGAVLLHGKNIQTYSIKTRAKNIAVLLQDQHLHFSQTVWDFVASARYPHSQTFSSFSEQDATIVADSLMAVDLYALKNKKVTALSGGEKRRLAIASVLTQSPYCYLLDEPTNHLDVKHQMQVLQHLVNLVKAKHDCAIIMTLHDVNLAQQFCHKIILFYGEHEILAGDTHTLLTHANLSRLYQHPFIKIKQDKNVFWYPKL